MKKLLAATLALVLISSPAWAALSKGATITVHDQDANADPWTFSHTVDANTAVLVVLCQVHATTGTLTSVTFNTTETLSDVITETHSGSGRISFIYRRINPTATTANIVVELSTGEDGGCTAVNYIGADTTTPLDGATSAEGNGSASSIDVTCASGNEAIVVGGTASLRTVTRGADQTSFMEADDGNGQYFASYEAGAGTNTMSYTWTGGATDFTTAGACVKAAVATTRPIAPFIFQ